MRRFIKEKHRAFRSILAILLILFQTSAPAFLLASPAFAQENPPTPVASEITLGFNEGSHELVLTGSVTDQTEYLTTYQSSDSDSVQKAVQGSVGANGDQFEKKIYIGSCSDQTCVPDQISRGTLVLPEAGYAATFQITDQVLWLNHYTVQTVAQVNMDTVYVAPQNPGVTVSFTALPENPGTLSIEEILLTEEQAQAIGAVSRVAYDITSTMENGTFEYDLTLPLPEGNMQSVQMVYAESVAGLAHSETVQSVTIPAAANSTLPTISATNLDHFTVFALVQPQNMARNITDVTSNSSSWFFYNDETDVIDNTLGSFVTGPATPPHGSTGSVQISVSGSQRRNLATYQFAGTPLASITELGFSTYNPSAGNGGGAERTGYLNFNVDFDGSDTWQSRLIFVPPSGAVVQDSWQAWDAIDSGNAVWHYSGTTWPGTAEPGTTGKTWSQILSDYTSARIRVTDAWFGIRVGSPYADGYTENIDAVVFGTAAGTTVFNFEPLALTAPTNLGWNTRSGSGVAGERPVDITCGATTNGDYPAYGNGMLAHNWSTTDTVSNLKYQRQWSAPGSGTWSTDGTIYTATNTVFSTFGSAAGTEGTWNTRVRSWYDSNDNNILEESSDAVSAWSNECAVSYDRTAPTVPTNPSPHGTTIATNNFDFEWNDSTDVHNITYTFHSSLNPAQTAGVLTTGLWTSGVLPTSMIHSSGAPNGTWYWQVRATDAAGNQSAWSPIWNVTLDTTAPAQPTGLKFWNAARDTQYQCDAYTQLKVAIPDWNDNTELDFDHYEYSSFHPSGAQGLNETILTVSELNNSWMPPTDGAYGFAVRAVDAVGNKSAWSLSGESLAGSCRINYDSIAPDVPTHLTPADGAYTITANLTKVDWSTVSDSNNPISYFYQSSHSNAVNLDGSFSSPVYTSIALSASEIASGGTPEGVYYWHVRAQDSLGNSSAWSTPWKITVDSTAPVTTDSGTDTAWHTSAVTVTLSCNDNAGLAGSGCKTTYYTTDGSTPTTASSQGNSVVVNSEGETTIKYFSVDNAGNSEAVKTASHTVKIDSTEPSSIITSYNLGNGGSVETTTFTGLIEGTAADATSGVDHVLLSISHLDFGADASATQYWNATSSAWVNTESTFRATGTTAWSYQLTSVPEGIYSITSHAVDAAGIVETTYQIKVVYDKTIPEVVLTIVPAAGDGDNGWYVAHKPTVTLTASDNYSLDHIEYQWNSTAGAWSTYSTALTVPGEGQHILYYRSIDTAGNVSTIGVKEVKYDATKPEGQAQNVKVENITSSKADGSWTAPANASGVDYYELAWKHENGTERKATVSNSTFKHELTDLFDGLWTFTVRPKDSAGNYIETKIEFRVGPAPSTATTTTNTPAVLGAATRAGVGRTPTSSPSTVLGENDTVEEETQINQEPAATEEVGAVLGATSCSTWQHYLPILLLALQLLLLIGYEALRRDPLWGELLVLGGSVLLVSTIFFMARDMNCYAEGSWVGLIAQWFIALAIGLAAGVKLIALAFKDPK